MEKVILFILFVATFFACNNTNSKDTNNTNERDKCHFILRGVNLTCNDTNTVNNTITPHEMYIIATITNKTEDILLFGCNERFEDEGYYTKNEDIRIFGKTRVVYNNDTIKFLARNGLLMLSKDDKITILFENYDINFLSQFSINNGDKTSQNLNNFIKNGSFLYLPIVSDFTPFLKPDRYFLEKLEMSKSDSIIINYFSDNHDILSYTLPISNDF